MRSQLHHFLLLPFFLAFSADAAEVASPDGRLVVTVELIDGQPTYAATWRGNAIIEPSAIRLTFNDQPVVAWSITGEHQSTVNETWMPVVGKRAKVCNRYNNLRIDFDQPKPNRACMVSVRVYDDGFAFRCQDATLDGADSPAFEQTDFRLAGDPNLWSYEKERAPVGPTRLSAAKGHLRSPVLAQMSGGFAAIHEANLRNTSWLEYLAAPGVLKATRRELAGRNTPWRVVQVGETLGELVDSDILANLNPKADAEEFAWVRPGVALWDWRSWGYNAPDGFKFGLNLESWKRFIDFAVQHDVPYVLLDANWYGPEFEKESNPFTGGVALDVRQAIDYGKQRGVGLILYLNDIAAKQYDVEAILAEWAGWGAAGIKYGFMEDRSAEAKVAWTRKIVAECAKNKLLVNFHDGPVPPAGCEATFPNWVTREFCHAQSDAKRAFTPSTFLMQMAVNQLAGPIDMNNGMFDLNRSVAERPRVFVEVPATITAEAARTLIVYSGMTVIPDATPVYERHPELFRFIASQKMPWTESRTLAFELGQYITMMRQTGDTYLVGSATNEEARELSIPLDFLPPGKPFTALVCEDASDAHYTDNREAYSTRTIDVDSTTVIQAKLAPGGGHCLLISPKL